MSLRFILGRSGSGKSGTLYRMIIKRSEECPDDQILLIVPEQYTMQAQKHLALLHPRHVVTNVDILSFERLAGRVFEEVGEDPKEILDDTGKSMIIRRLLDEHSDELSVFKGLIHRQGFVDEMKSVISELIQYGITPEALGDRCNERGIPDGLYSKVHDICIIYRAFLDVIHKRYITAEEVPDRLCSVIERSERMRRSVIYMDNFTGFTPVQYRLMERILAMCPEVVITLNIDIKKDPYKAAGMEDLFYMTKDTLRRLENICEEEGILREKDILLKNEAGYERAVNRKSGDPVKALCINDPESEMRFTAVKIHELVSSGYCRYEDIAVVASDVSLYHSSAKYWFKKYGIPCFFDMRRDVSDNMLVEWIRSLLGMFIGNFSYESVFRYLRCGLSGFELSEIDVLENYVLAMGIRGINRWQQEWTAKTPDMDESELVSINNTRKLFIIPLSDLCGCTGSGDVNVTELIRTVYLYMRDLGMREQLEDLSKKFESSGDLERSGEYAQIYDLVIGLLEQMNLILGGCTLNIKEFLDVLEAGLNDLRLKIIPPGIDQVTFGDIRRSRLDDIRVLFFAGMNEGMVPLAGTGKGLITDAEREIFSEHDLKLAPAARENAFTEQFYLYASLTKPSDKLIMTYSAFDRTGKEIRVSPVLEQVIAAFPGMEIIKVISGDTGAAEPDVNGAYQYMIDGLRDYAESGTASQKWEETFDWFYTDPKYAGQTNKLIGAAFYRHWDERLSQAAVKAVYHGELTGGVTMLEKYAGCAYSHFITYGLRLQERQVYCVQAPDIGVIFHRSLELFSKRVASGPYSWRTVPDGIRDKMIGECVKSVVLEYNNSVMKDSSRAEYLTEKILRMAQRTVWALQQQIRKGDFDPVGYEVKFTTDLNEDSMKIEYGDRGTLFLNGKIDRMDICESDNKRYIKIIDYKSGKTAFDLAKVYYGLQLQLMAYMNAAAGTEKEGHPNMEIVPAGIMYYHIDDPVTESSDFEEFSGEKEAPVPAAGQLSEDDIAVLDELAADGLVVDDINVISHLDRHPDEAPKVIHVEYNSDGELKKGSQAASREKFAALEKHVGQKTRNIGESIMTGDIPVRPYSYGSEKACDYCRYKGICGFDPSVEGYSYNKMKKMTDDKIWEALTREAQNGN